MLNLTEKYKTTPSFVGYDEQLRIMNELMDAGAQELLSDVPGLKYILQTLKDSYEDGGIFEYNEKDAATFDRFIDLLAELSKHIEWFQFKWLIDTFLIRGLPM